MQFVRRRADNLGAGSRPHLFLSHSSKDDDFTNELAENLNQCGVDVWLDVWELRVGDDLRARIASAIDKSKFVGVIVSQHFDSSRWMQGEVHQALAREETEGSNVVFPLLIEDIGVPPVLSPYKWLSFKSDEYFVSLARLAGAIHGRDQAALESAIRADRPKDVAGALEALRYTGFDPFYIVDASTLEEVAAAGGRRVGNKVWLTKDVLESEDLSPGSRHIVKRMIRAGRRKGR